MKKIVLAMLLVAAVTAVAQTTPAPCRKVPRPLPKATAPVPQARPPPLPPEKRD